MVRMLIFSTLLIAVAGAPALADPIVGAWRTKDGSLAAVSPCGAAYCMTMKSGEYAGRQIGRLHKDGATYAGKVTDPRNDKTYNGKATVSGATMTLKGCVLGGLICRGETWQRAAR